MQMPTSRTECSSTVNGDNRAAAAKLLRWCLHCRRTHHSARAGTHRRAHTRMEQTGQTPTQTPNSPSDGLFLASAVAASMPKEDHRHVAPIHTCCARCPRCAFTASLHTTINAPHRHQPVTIVLPAHRRTLPSTCTHLQVIAVCWNTTTTAPYHPQAPPTARSLAPECMRMWACRRTQSHAVVSPCLRCPYYHHHYHHPALHNKGKLYGPDASTSSRAVCGKRWPWRWVGWDAGVAPSGWPISHNIANELLGLAIRLPPPPSPGRAHG